MLRTNSEEKMLPLIRANLARQLAQTGFKVHQIARVLGVTQAAVTQYLKGVRGKKPTEDENQKRVIEALADKAAHRIKGNMEPLTTMELLDTAHQLLAVTSGEKILSTRSENFERNKFTPILTDRLQLELKAAQKCLDIANRAKDDYTRLLLRMIASDSIRHADIISQILSWLRAKHEATYELPDRGLLTEILKIEDSASEFSLRKTVRINHKVARLLLESIDMDEEKHERLIGMLAENPIPNNSRNGARSALSP
jgi:predicted transcriptional regulator